MLFKSARQNLYRCGVAASMQTEFAVPEYEADRLCRAGRSTEPSAWEVTLHRLHSDGVSHTQAAGQLLTTILMEAGYDRAQALARLCARNVEAVKGGVREVSLDLELTSREAAE